MLSVQAMAGAQHAMFELSDLLENIWHAGDKEVQRAMFTTFKQLRSLPTVTRSITDWFVPAGAAAVAVEALEQQWPKVPGVLLQRVSLSAGSSTWTEVFSPLLAATTHKQRIHSLFSTVTTVKLERDAVLVSAGGRTFPCYACNMPMLLQ